MKLNLKKYLWALNDLTNVLLKKDRKDLENAVKKLRILLIIATVLLLISLFLNIYQYLYV